MRRLAGVHAMLFKDRVVIVTGASSGIGAATAIQFSKEGASVVIIGRNQTKLKSVKNKCAAAGRSPLVINADLTDDNELKLIIDKTINKFGKINVLINNAAVLQCGNVFDDTITASLDEVMATNTRAVVFLTAYATPHLIASPGNIINISTIGGDRVICPDYGAYCIAKAALNSFSEAAALELQDYGVRVNTISPGIVKTSMLRNADFDMRECTFLIKNVMNCVTEAEEVADLILYVASDKAKGVIGSNFVTDNGNLLL